MSLDFFGIVEEALRKLEKPKLIGKVKLENAELDADKFLENIQVRILHKPHRDPNRTPWRRIFEQDHKYENFTDSPKTFKFQSNREERSTINLTLASGHTFTLGGSLGGSSPVGGASANARASYQYCTSTTRQRENCLINMKSSEVRGDIPPNSIVRIREVTYRVEEEFECDLELRIPKGAKVPYTFDGEEDTMKMSKVLEQIDASYKVECTSLRSVDEHKNKDLVRVCEGLVIVQISAQSRIEALEYALQMVEEKVERKISKSSGSMSFTSRPQTPTLRRSKTPGTPMTSLTQFDFKTAPQPAMAELLDSNTPTMPEPADSNTPTMSRKLKRSEPLLFRTSLRSGCLLSESDSD